MPISLDPMMMRQIIMSHYDNPTHKHTPSSEGYISIHSDSVNCIDDINIYIKVENDIVTDACFDGVSCTITTASTDIMCDLVIGKNEKDALYIIEQFKNMIYEKEFDADVLDEAIVFINTSKQAARIHCATMGWDGLNDLIEEHKHGHKN